MIRVSLVANTNYDCKQFSDSDSDCDSDSDSDSDTFGGPDATRHDYQVRVECAAHVAYALYYRYFLCTRTVFAVLHSNVFMFDLVSSLSAGCLRKTEYRTDT